jgi:hypothetical protein
LKRKLEKSKEEKLEGLEKLKEEQKVKDDKLKL